VARKGKVRAKPDGFRGSFKVKWAKQEAQAGLLVKVFLALFGSAA
jgi:hypothetical protein